MKKQFLWFVSLLFLYISNVLFASGVENNTQDKFDKIPEDTVVVNFRDSSLSYRDIKVTSEVRGPVDVQVTLPVHERKNLYRNQVHQWLLNVVIQDYKSENNITIPPEKVSKKKSDLMKASYGVDHLTDEFVQRYNEDIERIRELAKLCFDHPDTAEVLYRETYSSVMSEEEWSSVKSACKTKEGYLKFISYYNYLNKDSVSDAFEDLAISLLENEYVISKLIESGGYTSKEDLEKSLFREAVLDKGFLSLLNDQ